MDVVRLPAHGEKLKALLINAKLPPSDRKRVEEAVTRYESWIKKLTGAKGDATTLLAKLVEALNEYKRYVELDLIFDAEDDFLYRQKGQLKLDNTVLEEFLPYLFDVRLIPGLSRINNLNCGPQSSFAGLSFASPFLPLDSGGVFMKLKDQDFAISKSHHEGQPPEAPHIHIKGGGRDAKVWLEPEIWIADSYGFNPRELSNILRVVAENRDLILRAWHEHFSN